MTTVEFLLRSWTRVDSQQDAARKPEAKREFALAKTAIEDAVMRFNRGMAFERGVQMDFDFEQPLKSAS